MRPPETAGDNLSPLHLPNIFLEVQKSYANVSVLFVRELWAAQKLSTHRR